jgi:hypothetical protein
VDWRTAFVNAQGPRLRTQRSPEEIARKSTRGIINGRCKWTCLIILPPTAALRLSGIHFAASLNKSELQLGVSAEEVAIRGGACVKTSGWPRVDERVRVICIKLGQRACQYSQRGKVCIFRIRHSAENVQMDQTSTGQTQTDRSTLLRSS